MLRTTSAVIARIIGFFVILWATGALWYDLPLAAKDRHTAAAIFFILAFWLGVVRSGKTSWIVVGMIAFVTGWWFTLKPSNDRDWLPDVDRAAWAEIDGDQVTFHNVRNCDYRTETDFTPRWETRKVKLSKITGIDLAINYWGSPYMAHPIVSFQFSDSPPVCFSIETRKEKGESYSAIGGIYRQYELIYIVADERDVIRVRTNYRKGEDIYLYRLNITPEVARERFTDYLTALNDLRKTPVWYNALTTNCTTSIRTQRNANQRAAFDWRLLVNGKGDEWLYEKRVIGDGKLGFAELKQQSLIDDVAKAADASPKFSQLIRAKAPTFAKPAR